MLYFKPMPRNRLSSTPRRNSFSDMDEVSAASGSCALADICASAIAPWSGSVTGSVSVEHTYDEFIRMQSADRFMLAEKERGVRTFHMRKEQDKWVKLCQLARDERHQICGDESQRTTPSKQSDRRDSLPPSPSPAPSPRKSPALAPVAQRSRPVNGEDSMPDLWRDRFCGVCIRPTPKRDHSDDR